jgi:hypothetical protein
MIGSGSIYTNTFENGLDAICIISLARCCRLRCVSTACFIFHNKTHTARNKKKLEKNTEKNTKRSICGCR